MSVVKVMISLPQGLLEEIDQAARAEQRSRSELLREAARVYIQQRKGFARPGDSPTVQHAISVQDTLARRDTVAWDGVSEIRRWRTQH